MFALLARRRAYTASRNVSSFLRRTYSDRIIRSKPAMQDFAMGIQLTRFLRPSLISRCCSAYISAACVTRRLLGRPDGFGYGGKPAFTRESTRLLNAFGRRAMRPGYLRNNPSVNRSTSVPTESASRVARRVPLRRLRPEVPRLTCPGLDMPKPTPFGAPSDAAGSGLDS